MSDRYRSTGTGWPAAEVPPTGSVTPPVEPASTDPAPLDRAPADRVAPGAAGWAGAGGSGAGGSGAGRDASAASPDAVPRPGRGGLTTAGALIVLLLLLFGFTLVVQLRSNDTDEGLASARQEDLVRILSDLEAREQRLRQDIASLETSQRQLTSGVQGRQLALEAAARRADELGVLAGTLPARGGGLTIRLFGRGKPVEASGLLNAVQELRGAGAEAMQIAGGDGTAVRVVASSYFLDDQDGVLVDGVRLSGPYLLTVIGEPKTMRTALNIPGGVAESVEKDGGTVIVQESESVDVTALRKPTTPQYARPVS